LLLLTESEHSLAVVGIPLELLQVRRKLPGRFLLRLQLGFLLDFLHGPAEHFNFRIEISLPEFQAEDVYQSMSKLRVSNQNVQSPPFCFLIPYYRHFLNDFG